MMKAIALNLLNSSGIILLACGFLGTALALITLPTVFIIAWLFH